MTKGRNSDIILVKSIRAPPEAIGKQAGSATVKEDGAIIVAPPHPKIKEELHG